MNHIKGATALLELRGEQQLDHEFGRSLFSQARAHIVSGCYQTRSAIPDIVIQLSRKTRDRSSNPVEALQPIIFKFCNLRAGKSFQPPLTQKRSTTRTIVACCTSIAEDLATWYDVLPPAFLPSKISATAGSSDTLLEDYHIYEDLWTACIANNYRTNCILVHETLIAQLDFLRVHYYHDENEATELDHRISHSRSIILSLINAICASVPNLLQSSFAAAGVALLWPLYVSGQISPRSAPLDDGTRSWIIGRLESIGTDIGVCQATMLAGILSKHIEVTDLLKDE